MVFETQFIFPFSDINLDYLNIFLLSILTSIILFIPVPYAPILIVAAFNPNMDPTMIAAISALGVTIGRTLIFMFSYYGNRFLTRRINENMLPLKRLLKKYGWIGSFVAAITPFPPDDVVIIILGIVKLSPWKFIITNFLGKLVSNLLVVWSAAVTGKALVEQILLQSQNFTNIMLLTILSIIIVSLTVYSVLKMDWRKSIGKWFPWTLNDEYD